MNQRKKIIQMKHINFIIRIVVITIIKIEKIVFFKILFPLCVSAELMSM